MTTETITLSSFLLARLKDDEAVARAAQAIRSAPWSAVHLIGDNGAISVTSTPFEGEPYWVDGSEPWRESELSDHIARHDPARVLAECAAKRSIVESAEFLRATQSIHRDAMVYMDAVLAKLAAVYASHADYREGWNQ